jgi:hypothetical protein
MVSEQAAQRLRDLISDELASGEGRVIPMT